MDDALESFEEYEVKEAAPEADLDAAETVLAGMLVDRWLQIRGDSIAKTNLGQTASNNLDSQEDKKEQ